MQQCIEVTEDPKIHNMKQKFTNVPLVKKVNKKNASFRQPVLLVGFSMQQNKEDIFLNYPLQPKIQDIDDRICLKCTLINLILPLPFLKEPGSSMYK